MKTKTSTLLVLHLRAWTFGAAGNCSGRELQQRRSGPFLFGATVGREGCLEPEQASSSI